MIKLKNVAVIARKEIRGHLDNPSSGIAFAIFLLVWEFIFFRNTFLIGESSLRYLFDILPWPLLLFCAAISMASFSQEKSSGTLEVLLTSPVKETEIIAGKFLGALVFASSAVLFTLPIAAGFHFFGKFDWGAYLGQLISALFTIAAFLSLGLFFSLLFSSPIASLLLSSAVSFFLIIMGTDFISAVLPLPLVSLAESLAVSSHAQSFSKGVVDLRDIWYFVSFALVFLALAYYWLLKQKYNPGVKILRAFRFTVLLFIATAVISNIAGGRIPGRIDLTLAKTWSLSKATRQTLSGLGDIVNITFYQSGRLPGQLIPVVRQTKDILRDYETAGRGNIKVYLKDPSAGAETAREAQEAGVRENQFNVIGQEEFQIKTGFLGLLIRYEDKQEVIPFIDNPDALEYKITSLIVKLTDKNKPTVAFTTGHGEKSLYGDYQLFNDELSKRFKTISAVMTADNKEIASEAAVLAIAGPNSDFSEAEKTAVNNFLDSGKSLLLLIDRYTASPQQLSAEENQRSFSDLALNYGVSVNKDMVYDLRSNETVQLGQSGFSLLIHYPFWIRGLNPAGSPPDFQIEGLVMPWTASLTVDDLKVKELNLTVKPVAQTSTFAGLKTGSINLSPDKADFSRDNLAVRILAATAESGNNNQRIAVVGNSSFLTNEFVRSSPANLSFGVSLLSFLSSKDALADLKIKQAGSGRLLFSSPFEVLILKYGNLTAAVIVPALIIFFRLMRRKRLKDRIYRLEKRV